VVVKFEISLSEIHNSKESWIKYRKSNVEPRTAPLGLAI
jgi:hypothetical protein